MGVEVNMVEPQVTVATRVPKKWKEIIEMEIIRIEYQGWSEYLRDLIRDDLKKRGLLRKEEQ